MGYCKKHDAYNGNGYCPHCCTKEDDLHASNCPELRIAFERLERERDEARAEVERLKDEATELTEEVQHLRRCCTQRGARMQIMRDWMDEPRGLHTPGLWPPTEWYYFTQDRPEAEKWFDEDGVPVDAAREGE